MKRTFVPVLAGAIIVAVHGVMAQDRATLTELCTAQMVDTFGEVEVTFNKLRREENRNNLFGEVAMADGSTRRVRCQVRRGKVRDLGFGNAGGALGSRWSGDEPEFDDFARPEAENEEDQETAAQDPTAPDADAPETAAADGDQPQNPDDPDAETPVPDGETAAADTPAEGEDAAAEAEEQDEEEEVDPTAPRRMRVPQQ